MNNSNAKSWLTGKNLLVLVFGMLMMYLIVTSTVNTRLSSVEAGVREQISDQQALLTAIAEVTSRNGADEITESIVKDCTNSERSSFDNLLGRLDKGLTMSELTQLERLFGRCGSFFSERKSVMVSRLSREIEIYENYVEQLGLILDKDMSEEFSVALWRDLAREEGERSNSFTKLVVLQDKIINTLLSGKSANSDEIKSILQEVTEVQQALDYAKIQASNARSQIIPL